MWGKKIAKDVRMTEIVLYVGSTEVGSVREINLQSDPSEWPRLFSTSSTLKNGSETIRELHR
jgi:hypothetical protein